MVGWHHRLNGHEFEKTLGSSEGHGSLMFCSPWDCEESDMTDQLNNNKSSYLTLDLCALLRFMLTTKSSGKFPQQKTLHLLPCMTPHWLSPQGVCCQFPSFGSASVTFTSIALLANVSENVDASSLLLSLCASNPFLSCLCASFFCRELKGNRLCGHPNQDQIPVLQLTRCIHLCN